MSSLSFLNPLNWFKKRKGKLRYPRNYAIIEPTQNAIDSGISDDFNKIIKVYRDGKFSEEIEYSKEEERALVEVEKIPIIEEEYETEFNFDVEPDFGEVITRR